MAPFTCFEWVFKTLFELMYVMYAAHEMVFEPLLTDFFQVVHQNSSLQ